MVVTHILILLAYPNDFYHSRYPVIIKRVVECTVIVLLVRRPILVAVHEKVSMLSAAPMVGCKSFPLSNKHNFAINSFAKLRIYSN